MCGEPCGAPDVPLRVVLIDGGDGREVRRYVLEGVAACNRFIDCSSLTAGGGGTLLFLAHKDGAIWVRHYQRGVGCRALLRSRASLCRTSTLGRGGRHTHVGERRD